MKNLLVLAFMMSTSVMGGERVIIKDQKIINQVINDKTVKCSHLGYGVSELKINIEALNGWTMLDHSNVIFGDVKGLPCMTAGSCKGAFWDGFEVEDIILNNPRTEEITVQREYIEIRNLDIKNNDKCLRNFKEILQTNIAGIPFKHLRWSSEDVMPAAACTF